MKTLAAVAVIGVGTALTAWAHDHEHCPMAQSAEHRSAVDHRHDDATGVGHQVTEHHFALAKDGGSIRLEVKDPADVAGRDRIREHLQGIAKAFGTGDFSTPRRIHDQAPPGVDVLTARRAAIRYSYAATDKGGVVTMFTKDADALRAIHRFLRFQISDHGTADPTE
jgi:hypothetical protein